MIDSPPLIEITRSIPWPLMHVQTNVQTLLAVTGRFHFVNPSEKVAFITFEEISVRIGSSFARQPSGAFWQSLCFIAPTIDPSPQ